jgi:D-alanyl-D-alanine carboxypeptidase/D-alanyl-D-alanine-endopeptidase (penicillin-binding protein 4)
MALLCLAGAIALALSARPPGDTAAASPEASATPPDTPLASPRRAPALFLDALGRARLQRDLEAIAAPIDACVAVDDARGPLARVNTDEPLTPASNTKLLTALAALEQLGPDHSFRTRAVVDGAGNLILIGGGDPVLSSSETPAGAATPLDALADAVAQGERRNFNAILVDDSRYDAARAVPGWRPNYVPDGEVGSLGALAIDRGFTDVASRTAAADPALLTGERFQAMLNARGITTQGGPARTIAPADATEVAHVDSPSLSAIVEDMLRSSDNFVAEQLTREIGRVHEDSGTTAAGSQAIVEIAKGLSVPTDGVVLGDGSGLAPDNRVTCSALLQVLRMSRRPKFAAIDRGLPVAAQSGTLAERFGGDPLAGVLRAKTGSINGVASFSGVVDAGTRPRFAFVANGPFSEAAGFQLQADVAHAIGRYPDTGSAPELVPAP